MRDFAIPERDAIRVVFGNVDYGDAFHFTQACLRWLQKHGAHNLRSELATDLRPLWMARTLETFNQVLRPFRDKWRLVSLQLQD